ncbi:hypothetical protein AB838_06175 [Rhodobacteraceae bacterium (ex Bugula neritina AB1)]|nr:hypothetical protein AB838_06175 [Rhodobacteraceae bacterium (ex Bugula neritina AB1)]
MPDAVGIVLGLGSASVPTVLAAAARKVTPVFVLDRQLPGAEDQMQQLPPRALLADITGQSDKQAGNTLAGFSLKGITTFSEYALPRASALACALGLPGHDAGTVKALTEKTVQREALSAAGVHACRFEHLPAGSCGVPPGMVFPAVLKPVVGAGSVHTLLVRDETEFRYALAQAPQGIDFIVEEFFQGDPAVAGADFGDYVSVESLHCDGQSQQICVTGKLPLTPSFRETGMFLPCSLPQPVLAEVRALEAQAVAALGVRHGITHTEIKLTSSGPKIIEVNGRLGGYVPEILKRASDVNLVQLALLLAVGKLPSVAEPGFEGVTYQVFLTPPDRAAGRIGRIGGIDSISEIEGVRQVEVRAQPGDLLSAEDGTQGLLGVVYGQAADSGSFAAAAKQINDLLHMEIST